MRFPAQGLDYRCRRCGNEQVGVVFVALTKETKQELRL